ncbi:hypothetical protein PGB90_009838 [Kerria lacca]
MVPILVGSYPSCCRGEAQTNLSLKSPSPRPHPALGHVGLDVTFDQHGVHYGQDAPASTSARWTYSIIKKGRKKSYDVADLPSPLQKDFAQNLGNKMEKIGTQLSMAYFLTCLRTINAGEDDVTKLIYAGLIFIVFNGVDNLSRNHFLIMSTHLGYRIKVALSSLLYRKCLRLDNNSSGDTSAGLVVNLLSNDFRQCENIIAFSNYFWSGIITALLITLVTFYFFGIYPAIALITTLFLAMPLQTLLAKLMARNRLRIVTVSGKRIQQMDEIICGIHIIKMYAWEKPYEKLINVYRNAEMKLIKKGLYLQGVQNGLSAGFSMCSIYLVIVIYTLSGGEILPDKVFSMLGFCGILTMFVCGFAFKSVGECSQCYVSIKRMQVRYQYLTLDEENQDFNKLIYHFLELKEFEKIKENKSISTDYSIKFINVKANWSTDSNKNTLKNICLTINKEELVIIIGQVGCGKSSLLNVILGELRISEGKFDICGTVSYYSQTPWIFAGTIRQNILFSENFEKSRYVEIIEVCALNKDLQNFPNGDLTLIGERGITLSGGQKARIALARTLYKRANIYLLDDPLSAVDTNISREIFDRCILGFLKNTTRILITHQLQYLTEANKIVLLHEGTIYAEGTFNEIISKANYLDTLNKTKISNEHETNEQNSNPSINESCDEEKIEPSDEINEKKELEKENDEETNPNALIQYLIKGAGIRGILIVLFLYIISQLIMVSCDVWLTLWTEYTISQKIRNSTEIWILFTDIFSPLQFFIVIYTILIICAILFIIMRNLCYFYYGQKCSKIVHNNAFQRVIYTNTSFFHNNPCGRILNRFSKDLAVADTMFLFFMFQALTNISQIMAYLIITASIDFWYFIPMIICVISLEAFRRYYSRTTKTLKRLENITNSPIFAHLHCTLQGLPIIRVSSFTNKFIEEFDHHQDVHTSAWFLYYFSAFGYVIGLSAICYLYIILIVIGCFFLKLSGSAAGLALSQCTFLLGSIQWAMICIAEILNQTTSIDRLMDYSSLPSEMQPETDDSNVNKNWPSKGEIIFENVGLRYNISAAPSIHNVSFTIESRQKVGIVGRTGAGKTSLLIALLRMGLVEGTIKIDDIDTSTVRLEKLRSKISIIPQDPILFSGTMRKNLDPFDEYSDNEIWEALSQAEIKKSLSKVNSTGLDTMISEGGKNFSVGERQLICLARAILRKNKILVLDEATANVDQQTDSIIQRTIKETFKSCTVLTIAHRLNTIIDSDKVLVMDCGTIVEYDHPYTLLLNQETIFYNLISKTGQYVATILIERSKKKYNEHLRKIKNYNE